MDAIILFKDHALIKSLRGGEEGQSKSEKVSHGGKGSTESVTSLAVKFSQADFNFSDFQLIRSDSALNIFWSLLFYRHFKAQMLCFIICSDIYIRVLAFVPV